MAYQLDGIEERDFPAEENLTREDLRRNDLTIKNIRLWNDAPLLQTYGQLQEIRTYYKFTDVDNDRYMINGELPPGDALAAGAVVPGPAVRTCVNEHLTYTHGYGVVMGPVNRVTSEGLPEFFIKDIPPASSTNVKVTRPEIYYGETSNDYVFVRTKAPEFDYPVGDKNVYSRYEGKGGVPLTFFRKLLFASQLRLLYHPAVQRHHRGQPHHVPPQGARAGCQDRTRLPNSTATPTSWSLPREGSSGL